MNNPVATYRIQFHQDFSFESLEAIIPYLQRLGIRTLYASPVFGSVKGSTHGYDGVDPLHIDADIGTEAGLRRISGRLQEAGIGWLQDIVPNHMAFHPQNAWLMDVLEKGQASPYAPFFDIDWSQGDKIMLPFLGATLDEALKKGDLKIIRPAGRWMIDYSGAHYPLNEESVRDYLTAHGGHADPEQINKDTAQLRTILDAQHYRFCHWQETDHRINFRRFFTVNGLICLNIHDPVVFERFHEYAVSLLKDGVFSGLRIDHIDGLYDPATYLDRLRTITGPDCYIVVEKILGPGEEMVSGWPIQGSTGYDFLAMVNSLFRQRKSERALTRFYQKLTSDDEPLSQQLNDKKAYILHQYMAGELDNLTRLFIDSGLADGPYDMLQPAIAEWLIQCPVYRFYGSRMPLRESEALKVRDILDDILDTAPELASGVRQLETALLLKPREHDDDYNRRAAHFYQRCMQYTGPLMAKGVEDTLMYTYSRFIGNNDVGDSPDSFASTREDFHKAMMMRQLRSPLTMNATSSHDTKRGEDARALLNVLTDVPHAWQTEVTAWHAMNAMLRPSHFPDVADEYFIYQTLFASYPFEEAEQKDYAPRLAEYLQKALREGKRRSDWAAPDEEYEGAVTLFANSLLDDANPFLARFVAFRDGLLDAGMIQALAQLILKITCPGIPDIYQGSELWDLSMVDPDNRRPVDFATRAQWLDKLITNERQDGFFSGLWQDRRSGRIKLWLTHKLLQLRGGDPELFTDGHYLPLRVEGKYRDHMIAYARRYDRRWLIVAVPMHLAAMKSAPLEIDWEDTAITLPQQLDGAWSDLLGGGSGRAQESIQVKDAFKRMPFAVMMMEQPANNRAAGVLLPVSALPAPYGIGDFGPEARRFARMLSRAGQRYWQLLPLNPVSGGSGYSPYSSNSTMAGNPMLISPELLMEEGLVEASMLAHFLMEPSDTVDYEAAEEHKTLLLEVSYDRYCGEAFTGLRTMVDAFCRDEAYWLDDFALFVVLQRAHDGKPWYKWPQQFRTRQADALKEFIEMHASAISFVKWQQAMVSKQWKGLRAYCNSLGIQLIGDLPFYASHDSADVWSYPECFSVDSEGRMTGVAGVPPDYFSASGQLWGMPTFRWEHLKAEDYRWWIWRLRKNLELYDLLRIDHFRAMASYWEVPAGEETAINGRWIAGPGAHFFQVVEERLGGLPFIAEDLGGDMEDAYKLRDEVGLPGMKIIQFAFGENLPTSVDAPHNYGVNCVAYTGTHDNNTTLGWFRREASADDRRRISDYGGSSVSERNVTGVIARMVYASVARIAILPLQDVLGLNEGARMNTPSSVGVGNWRWRMSPDGLREEHITWLRVMALMYNRT